MSDFINNVRESQLKTLDNLVERFTFLEDKISEYKEMLKLVENEIIDYYEELKIDKRKNLKLIETNAPNILTIKELKNEFNSENSELLDKIVVKIMLDETMNSMYYTDNLQESIVNSMKVKLTTMNKYKIKTIKRDKV